MYSTHLGFPVRGSVWKRALIVWLAWTFAGCDTDESEASIRPSPGEVDQEHGPAVVAMPEDREPDTEPTAIAQSHTADEALGRAAVGGPAGARIAALMDAEAERLRAEFQGMTVERIAEGIKITMDVGVTFDQSSDRLAPESMDYLSRLAVRLKEFPNTNVLIVAHTDRTGDQSGNLRLSERRAQATVTYLANEGIVTTRMTPIGRGESEPVFINDGDESEKRANRRIEIAVFASDAMKSEAFAGVNQP